MRPAAWEISHEEQQHNVRYVVITPVRNEADFIDKTIHSMVQQAIKPVEWIIVDDGSSDKTAEIVAEHAIENPWIKLVSREDRGNRQRGKGVIEAFYAGYQVLTWQNYDFIVKLDGDLSFGPDYFESLLREFAANPKLGIAGGGVYERPDGIQWVLRTAKDHVRGPTKVYRRACFEDIGGLVPALGWDGIDEWKALTFGWQVRSFTDLRVLHYRFTGAATGSLKSRLEEGYGAHFMGYHPLYLLARGIRQMVTRPYVVGGLAMVFAYFTAWMGGRKQLADRSVISYVRRTQLKKLAGLLAGKQIHEW